jgi:ribosome biogenesis GTPase
LQGIVYKSTGSWYLIKEDSGVFWNARIKGKLKIDGEISSTNPIAVGDRVAFDMEDESQMHGMIKQVLPRDNYIVRLSPHNANLKHIVASNIDLALLVATIAEPRTSLGFIDRFMITAEAYGVPAILVVNKIDILEPKHMEQLEHWKQMYEGAGYQVLPLIALQPETLEVLKEVIRNKTTLFSGHSGVGKSTLINQLIPGKDLRTGEVSGWSGKGQHTTTFAEMLDLPEVGRIIDTPGVKEFGLIDVQREELSQYFPEMKALMNQCKFNNCLHINEPGCAVKEAVFNGTITEDRYVSYVGILESIEKKW